MHTLELSWIQQLHDALRSPCLDQFMYAWSFVDSFGFAILIIGLVWYLVSQKLGVRLFYILLLSSVINTIIKHIFDLPRPCHIDPGLGIICLSNPGFPSGAAQTAILLPGIIFFESKKRLYRILGVFFGAILCFSRVYLGVHFISDVLGGLVIGGLLLIIYQKIFPLAQKNWKTISFIFPFVILLISPSRLMIQFGVALGFALGLFVESRKPMQTPSKNLLSALTKAFAAILGAFIIFELGHRFNPDLRGFFAIASGFWFSYASVWSIRRFSP